MAKQQNSMTLKEFISEALTGIAQGVKGANKVQGQHFVLTSAKSEPSSFIEFDIAVVTKSAKGGGMQIVVLGIGVGGGLSKETERVSRIKFKVLHRSKA